MIAPTKTHKIALVFLIVFCREAYSSDWIILANNSEVELQADVSSVANSGSNKKAWFQLIYSKQQKQSYAPYSKFDSSKTLWIFNCNEKTWAVKQQIDYLGSKMVGSLVLENSQMPYKDIAPDTLSEVAHMFVCN